MQIGVSCFKDIEIRSIITSEERSGDCEITGQRNAFVYDTSKDSYLDDYISEVLSIYIPISELSNDFPAENIDNIEKILVENWSLFNTSETQTKLIIMEICKNTYSYNSLIFNEKVGMEKLCDTDFVKRNSLVKESTWEKFMGSIKNTNRFHSKHINLELLEKLFKSPSMQFNIKKGEMLLYRGRICEDKVLSKKQMGPPPTKLAASGRANSAGISCLYLASDITTTLHEIRARDLDYVSVATFISKKKLKIVDLSNLNNISPFSVGSFDYEWFAINMSILKKINYEIAKPLRRQDSELDYLPAQYISDFVKSLDFDGICYRSTLNNEGLNYAFFDHNKFKCIDIKLYHISSLAYMTKPSI